MVLLRDALSQGLGLLLASGPIHWSTSYDGLLLHVT